MRWKLDDNGKIFRAVLTTNLSRAEIATFLKERLPKFGFRFRSEKEGTMKFGKGLKDKKVTRFPDTTAAHLNFTFKDGKLKVRYMFQNNMVIRDNFLGYLIVTMEELEHSLHDLEDVMVVTEGTISDNGASLRDDKGEYLVKGMLGIKSKADAMYGWRMLPVMLLLILGLILVLYLHISGDSWTGIGIIGLVFVIIFPYMFIFERELPSKIILEPDNIILKNKRKEQKLTYESVDSLTGPSPANDFLMVYIKDGKKKTAIGYEAGYRISLALDNRNILKTLEKWMLPPWRMVRDGHVGGIPNRIHSNEETRARGYRNYMLRDPLRTLILVNEEQDRKILLEAARRKWNDQKQLEELLQYAILERYNNEIGEIGKRLLEFDPDDQEVLKSTFSSLLLEKKLDEANRLVTKRIEGREPTSYEEFVISSIHYESGRVEEALYNIGRAVEKDPNNLDALRSWIHIVSSESGKAQAISEIDYLSTQHPKAWGPPCALGEWMFNEGDPKEAERYLKSAMEREPSEQVIGFMSALYGSNGRFQELIDLVENAQKKGSCGVPALINLTQAYISLGSWRKAKTSLELAAKNAPLEFQPALFDKRLFLNEMGVK